MASIPGLWAANHGLGNLRVTSLSRAHARRRGLGGGRSGPAAAVHGERLPGGGVVASGSVEASAAH